MELNKIGVLGAGVMGCDLALDLALHNYRIILYDNSQAQLDCAKDKIEQQFRFYKMMNPNAEFSIGELLGNIKLSSNLNELQNIEFIVENIIEDWFNKKKLYTQLVELIDDNCIVASNTSCIPITKIASLMKFPHNIIGTHFMNPVPFKKFVEVIKGKVTSEDTINRTLSFIKSLGKKTVVVNDSPGFVSNRVLMLTINESIRTVEEGIAKPEDVDKIFKLGFAHAMGPLATADLIGLDTIMYSLDVLYEEFEDAKFKPCDLIVNMVNEGLLGRKSGKGFFNY